MTRGSPRAQWRRLDARMLLVNPVQELIRFFPLVIGAVVLGSSTGDGSRWQLFGIAIPIVIGMVRFLITRFRVTDTQVELRRGLIGQTVLTARLDRVRTVELTSTLIHRVLGLSRVEIGTGSGASDADEKFRLDALPTPEARELRAALLHRVRATEPSSDPAVTATEVVDVPEPEQETVLLTLDPRWVRYAPLTASGAVIAAGLLALLGQFGDELFGTLIDPESVMDELHSVSILLLVAVLLAGFLLLAVLFAVLGYLATNWDFRLTRDALGRSFHVRRGLFTNTETSMEIARLRGVEIHEPLGLRLAGAGRALAIVTGFSSGEQTSRVLAPPAPIAVVRAVGDDVLGVVGPVQASLVPHGPAARRRRFTRALVPAALLPAIGVVVCLTTTVSWWLVAVLLLALPLAAALAADRYRRLGHALAPEHLVVQTGGLTGRRSVLQRTGVISWNIEQSWFQRRAGLVNLVATTAAGAQAYAALDIPEPLAVRLAATAVPGLLDQFLTVDAAQMKEQNPSMRRR